MYEHVAFLNELGFKAKIVHKKRGYCYPYATFSVPIVTPGLLRSFQPNKEDILVFDEISGPDIIKQFPGIKKVIFNQNCYYTFRGGYDFSSSLAVSPYRHEDVIAAMVVSADSADYLQYVFPSLTVVQIPNTINREIFRFNSNKKPIIAFMPRKNKHDCLQVINILREKELFQDFSLTVIDDMTPHQVAKCLYESAIFLCFGAPEGFQLPVAEALACGCLVIGYDGGGAKEFFNYESGFPIAQGDIINFAKTVITVATKWQQSPQFYSNLIARGQETVLKRYTADKAKKALQDFWQKCLADL